MSETLAIDAELGEALQANEEQIAKQIAAAVSEQIERESGGGKRRALRDAHPKSHGCVEAEFRVDDDVRPELAQGVFVPEKSYRAWIRFSNGSPKSKPDIERDVRGVAIKLLDVPGDKILAEEREARTQDFVLMSCPKFFMDDAVRYLRLSRAIASSSKLGKLTAIPALGLRGFLNVQAAKVKIASPLEAPTGPRSLIGWASDRASRRSSTSRVLNPSRCARSSRAMQLRTSCARRWPSGSQRARRASTSWCNRVRPA